MFRQHKKGKREHKIHHGIVRTLTFCFNGIRFHKKKNEKKVDAVVPQAMLPEVISFV